MYGDYVSQDSRIQSFSTWPVQLSQTPAQLASAGFFYTGCGDKVRCFSAGCGLEMWQPEDDPILEHEKWYPDCFFVRMKAAMATTETPATSEETRGETSDPAEPVCKICLTESAQVRTSSLSLLTPHSSLLHSPSQIVFVPCGHLLSCPSCAPSLASCPVCRSQIKGMVRAYLA